MQFVHSSNSMPAMFAGVASLLVMVVVRCPARCSYEVEANHALVLQKGVAGGQVVHRGVSERCCSPFAGE